MKKLSLVVTSTLLLIAGSLTQNALCAAAPAKAVQRPISAATTALHEAFLARKANYQRLLEIQGVQFMAAGGSREQLVKHATGAWIKFNLHEEQLAKQREEYEQEQQFTEAFLKARHERIEQGKRKAKNSHRIRKDALKALVAFENTGTLTPRTEARLSAIVHPGSLRRQPLPVAGSTALPARSQTPSANTRLTSYSTPELPLLPTAALPAVSAPPAPARSTSSVKLPSLTTGR